MAGIDPYTGEKIYYPGERRTKWQRRWEGSPMWGGGIRDAIPPLMFFLAVCSLVYGISLSEEEAREKPPVTQEQLND